MKKVTSLIMTLVLCLSLCACGNASVSGTYEGERYGYDFTFKEVLTLNSDGTGTIEGTATSPGKNMKIGDIYVQGTVKWTSEGDYITITSSLQYKGFGTSETTTTYKRMAGALHDVSNGNLEYIKVG